MVGKLQLLLALLGAAALVAAASPPSKVNPADLASRAEHVVVLMMENHSLENMLGWLKQTHNSQIHGLDGSEFNNVNASDPTSQRCAVRPDSPYRTPDPCHYISCHNLGIFGHGPVGGTATMSGWVENFNRPGRQPCDVMRVFNFTTVPVISTLATEFALFDNWHASVPGPTFPNRLFAHAGTSQGSGTNDLLKTALGYPLKTVFELLDKKDKTWGAYFELVSDTLLFQYTRQWHLLGRQKFMDEFFKDAAAGTLPNYSFLSPSWSDMADLPASDQHPDHDIAEGERLIKRVYEALRRSPLWEKTVLVITYDEGGGFYSKYVPLSRGVPNPDGRNTEDTTPSFHFDRLGVRVPTVVVSPWIRRGRVEHAPAAGGAYEHSSIPATLTKLFGLEGPLTKRDAWAASFHHIWEELSQPRKDCPTRLPEPPGFHPHNQFLRGIQPMTDLSEDFAHLVAGLVAEPELHAETVARAELRTEADAGRFMRKGVEQFLGRQVFGNRN